MKNTIIYLLGFPGTGKYTTAKAICTADADFRLVDNHLINNPVFSLIRQDGVTPLPPLVWDHIGRIWEVIRDTIVHLSPPEFSFVLTNALSDQGDSDRAWFAKVQKAADERGAIFVPVRLSCALEEMERRIVMPDRKARMKETDPASPRRNLETRTVLTVDHPHKLDLDVTSLLPEETARIILAHAAGCTRKSS